MQICSLTESTPVKIVNAWVVGTKCARKKSRPSTVWHFTEISHLAVMVAYYILDMWEFISSENSHAAHLYRKYTILCDFMDDFSKQHVY